MSLALIQESAKEVRRLAIAGSSLAVGDFRLKKLLAPLEQAGAKVPVFAQVAKGINELVNGTEADSPARLLGLSTLLNAILYTQGQTGAEGELQDIEVFETKCASTRTSARALKPVIEALTTNGGGRFEIIKSAVERGLFHDLRLIDPAIQALGDSYPELADLVAEKILPEFGPGIVPRLKENLDLKGKKVDARRLGLMHRLDPAGTLDLCKTALETGSPEVKAEAVACLGKHEECLPLVMEQAQSRNKPVRAAALEALAAHDRPDITKLFTDLIKGKSLDILVAPLRAVRSLQVLSALLHEGERILQLLLNGEEEQVPRFWGLLNALETRKEPAVEEFFLRCLEQGGKLAKLKSPKNQFLSGDELVTGITARLHAIGSPRAHEAILDRRNTLPEAAFPIVLNSALRTWAPAKVYDEFSVLLGQAKGAAKAKGEALQRVFLAAHWDSGSRFNLVDNGDTNDKAILNRVEWDPRWLDAAIKADARGIVCVLARPGHKGAVDYLVRLADAKSQAEAGLVVHALARCQYPQTTDVFLKLVSKRTRGARYLDYELQFLFESARHLPKGDLPRLDDFASTLDDKFLDKYLEGLAPLRSPATPTP